MRGGNTQCLTPWQLPSSVLTARQLPSCTVHVLTCSPVSPLSTPCSCCNGCMFMPFKSLIIPEQEINFLCVQLCDGFSFRCAVQTSSSYSSPSLPPSLPPFLPLFLSQSSQRRERDGLAASQLHKSRPRGSDIPSKDYDVSSDM